MTEKELYHQLYNELISIKQKLNQTTTSINQVYGELQKLFSIEEKKVENENLDKIYNNIKNIESSLNEIIIPDIQSNL